MKIMFFDVKELELDYLKDKLDKNIEGIFLKTPLNSYTFIDKKFKSIDALSVFVSSDLTKEVLSQFKNLKYIFLRCVGFSNIDLKYCEENNIKIFNTPNYGNSTVAEYVFALILEVSKRIYETKSYLKEGFIEKLDLEGIELFSKTLGVIGVGAIGRKVINIAHGFNMNVLAYDIEKKGAYNFVELDELLEKSDFISINCPLNSSTKGMINSESISKMKKDVVLINCARGEIVETKALYDALMNKKIKAAALDVVECEEVLCSSYSNCKNLGEISENCLKKFFFIQKLLKMPNVTITPHNAYNTKEAKIRILEMTLENIQSSFNISSSTKNLVLI